MPIRKCRFDPRTLWIALASVSSQEWPNFMSFRQACRFCCACGWGRKPGRPAFRQPRQRPRDAFLASRDQQQDLARLRCEVDDRRRCSRVVLVLRPLSWQGLRSKCLRQARQTVRILGRRTFRTDAFNGDPRDGRGHGVQTANPLNRRRTHRRPQGDQTGGCTRTGCSSRVSPHSSGRHAMQEGECHTARGVWRHGNPIHVASYTDVERHTHAGMSLGIRAQRDVPGLACRSTGSGRATCQRKSVASRTDAERHPATTMSLHPLVTSDMRARACRPSPSSGVTWIAGHGVDPRRVERHSRPPMSPHPTEESVMDTQACRSTDDGQATCTA